MTLGRAVLTNNYKRVLPAPLLVVLVPPLLVVLIAPLSAALIAALLALYSAFFSG